MSDEENFNWISIPLIIRTPRDIRRIVRIGSRRLFIDYPNEAYMGFLKYAIHNIMYVIMHQHSSTQYKGIKTIDLLLLSEELINEIYKMLVDLKDMYNKYLKTNDLDWFKITVTRAVKWSKSSFILGYRVDHRKFKEFINKISSGELWSGDLSKIYDYINGTKYVILENTNHVYLRKLTNQVHIKVLPELNLAQKFLLELENEFYSESEYIRRLMRGSNLFYPLLFKIFLVLKGIEIILSNIKQHLDTPPMVYRELRKVLEHLAHLYFELNILNRDLRSYLELQYDLSIFNQYLDLVTIASSYWDRREFYQYAKKVKVRIDSLGKLVDKAVMEELTRELKAFIPVISKNKLEKAIKRNLSWSILLTIGSLRKEKIPQHKYKEFITGFTRDTILSSIVPLSAYTLLLGLQETLQFREDFLKYLSEVQRILRDLVEKYNYVFPYPLPTFLVQYVSYRLGERYEKIYDNYSYFVHPYINSIEYYPFLSIIEYKVLVYELKKYSDAIKQLLSSIIDIVKTLQQIE